MWEVQDLFQLARSDGKGSHWLQTGRDQSCSSLQRDDTCQVQMATLPHPQLLHSWQHEPQPLPDPSLVQFLPRLCQETCEIQRPQEAALIS